MEKQSYDLEKAFILNSMHDQQVNDIELKDDKFIMHYNKLTFCNSKFHSCDIIFSGIEHSDVYAEIRKEKKLKIRSVGYYDKDFVEFIKRHKYIIETIKFYCTYKEVIIYGALMKDRRYFDDCVIRVTASNVSYEWQ